MKALQVGKSYKDGYGDSYIISLNEGEGKEHYPYKGTNLETGDQWLFTKQGFFLTYATGCSDLLIPDEPEQTTELTTVPTKEEPKVPHLDVILAIVQKIPVQYDYMQTGTWHDYNYTSDDLSPVNYPEYNWRIKPQPEPKRTVQIGKRTVVAPEVKAPEIDDLCWITGWTNSVSWDNDRADNEHLAEGRVFLTKQDADNCQEAIIALLLGKD